MRRLLLFVCTILVCLTGCTGQTDPPKNPYRLKIHAQEDTNSGHKWEMHYSYNSQGHTDQIQELSNGTAGFLLTFEYDDWGNILRQTTKEPDGTLRTEEHDLTLDADHRVIYDETFYAGILIATTEAAYDKDGNQIMQNINRIGSLDGEDIISYVDRIYDEKGNLLQERARWSHNADSGGISTYTYRKDQIVWMEYRGHDGKLNYFIEYSYDETGLIQTAMQYDADNVLFAKTVTTFDEYGNELQSEYYRYMQGIPGGDDDMVDRIITYTYEPVSHTAE